MNNKDTFIPPKNKNDMSSVLRSLIKNKNVGVFIDSANLYYAANKASLKIDYFQISRWFSSHCNLTTLNFYTAYDPLDERQGDFFVDLEKAGYNLIKKPIRVFADSVKGNMDIELAVDVLMNQDKFETLVLISGDGDFQRLIQALDQLNKKTIILGVGGFTSYELHQEADNYFFLNRIQEVWKKTSQRTSSKQVSLPSKITKDSQTDDQTNRQSITKTQPATQTLKRTPKAPAKKTTEPKPESSGTEHNQTPLRQAQSRQVSTTRSSHSSRPQSQSQTSSPNPLPRVKIKIDPDSKPKIFLD
jgi:uncharacterized LabA/DUF88 family protein